MTHFAKLSRPFILPQAASFRKSILSNKTGRYFWWVVVGVRSGYTQKDGIHPILSFSIQTAGHPPAEALRQLPLGIRRIEPQAAL